MRLIDADTLKERAIKVSTVKEHVYMKAVGTKEIDKAPTIDPKDLRPKCTWEQIYEDAWECSNCGACWTCIEGDPTDNDMHFCPVCGDIIEEVVK